jgi:hypothetical protein
MPTIGINSSVTRVENNKKVFGTVVSIYKKKADGCKAQTVYNVLWDSYLCPVPHFKSEITQNMLGDYPHNGTSYFVNSNAAKQKIENDIEIEIAIERLNDASITREQCVRIMKQNPVCNEILIISERGIKKKNEDRIIKNRRIFKDQYTSLSDDKENIEIVDERVKPVWKDSIVTCHYFTQDSPVFSDNSTCSPFKYV